MEEIKEKKKDQKAEAIAKAKYAARRSPRSRDVKVFMVNLPRRRRSPSLSLRWHLLQRNVR